MKARREKLLLSGACPIIDVHLFLIGSWFFTHNLLERHRTLLIDHVEILRCTFRETQYKFPFEIAAIVILPDHLHAVWTLPPEDADFATRWRLIKTHFSKSLANEEWRSTVRTARGERGSGSGAIGSTSSAMTPTTNDMSKIVISIP